MKRLPVAGPSITAKEIAYVTDAVTNCWYDEANVYHQRFEAAAARYLGVRHAVALPSCTSAIHLSLLAAGVGPGDEVIVPDVTWIASSAPISYVGATAVFADIDPDTWCLATDSLEQSITSRTKAVIAVDLYGGTPRLEEIGRIARRHNLFFIEDAAEAFGSMRNDKQAGSFGDTGVFSFHGSKTLTTGEGGLLVTDRDDIHRRVLFLRDHGRQPGDTNFFNAEVAYKYKMSSMQAALGLAQVERAEELVGKKREIFEWYRSGLSDCPAVTLNHEPAGTRNSYWMSTVVIDKALGLSKRQLVAALAARGIDSRPFFHPLSAVPAYANTAAARQARRGNRVAYHIAACGVNLPSALCLTRDDVLRVCAAIREIIVQRIEQSGQQAAA